MPSLTRFAVAVAMVLGIARVAPAESLLARVDESGGVAGVRRAARLALGHTALRALRDRESARLPDFPLGTTRTATLVLRRFAPLGAHTRIEVMEAAGPRPLAPPDATYFTGSVEGEPDSRALVVAGAGGVHGFVVSGGEVYRFGPDATGTHRSYALGDVEPGAYPPPGAFCLNDAHPRLATAPAGAPRRAAAPAVAATGLREAQVAIETDREFRQKFASDAEALDYLADLLAAASAIYERDVSVRLLFSYIRLWNTTDPWTATDTIAALDEVQAYWIDPAHQMSLIAGPRDTVHFISGKPVQGGVAYVASVCDQTYGFGVSQVYGAFDLSNPSTLWDLLVVTHELGHNFGSPHTHCYNPPVDRCYNAEPACYAGPVVQTRGTIMSYCHLLGGVENVDLLFGGTVSNQISATVATAACLDSIPGGTCGNGTVEPGEQCDDGGNFAGDGCSPACRFEVCGNLFHDPGEACDDGNTVSGDGCSPTCTIEPLCGDGTVDPGEDCDDGNRESGDGCSIACHTEPCLVVRSGQTIWSRARVSVRKPGAVDATLGLSGTFTLPMPVAQLGLATAGVRMLVESAAGLRRVDLTLPPGPAWLARPGRWLYRDRAGSADGIRKVVIRDRTRDGVPDVQVRFAGRGAYGFAADDLPLTVTLVLGDAAAGQAGACGRYAFDGGSCRASRHATRLLCR